MTGERALTLFKPGIPCVYSVLKHQHDALDYKLDCKLTGLIIYIYIYIYIYIFLLVA